MTSSPIASSCRLEKYFEPVTKRLPKRIPGSQSLSQLYESLNKKQDKQN